MKPFFAARPKMMFLETEQIIGGSMHPAWETQELYELAQSILQNGLLQPITVRAVKYGKFELIAGEKRLQACKLANLKIIPAVLYPMSDEKAACVRLLEDFQHEPMTPLEQAKTFERLMQDWNCDEKTLSEKLGISEFMIQNYLKFLILTQQEQDICTKAKFQKSYLDAFLRLENPILRYQIMEYTMKHQYTIFQTESLIEKILEEEKQKQKKRIMVKDVQIFLNTIDHAIQTMTGNGIPAVAQKKQEQEYIEYVVRIPTPCAVG